MSHRGDVKYGISIIRWQDSKGSLGTGNESNQKTGRHLDNHVSVNLENSSGMKFGISKDFREIYISLDMINILMPKGISPKSMSTRFLSSIFLSPIFLSPTFFHQHRAWEP